MNPVNEKAVSLTAEEIRALIKQNSASFKEGYGNKAEFCIGQYTDNEIEVKFQPSNPDEDESESITGNMRFNKKYYKLDDQTCRNVIQEVRNYLENRSVPTAKDLIKTPAERMEMGVKEFFDGAEKVLTILTDPRVEKLVDQLIPKVGTLIGKAVGNFGASIDAEVRKSAAQYK
jgi:hypothetical protein